MNSDAWAATALHTHPYTVRLLHENYIRAGVDIITVNSYSAARHNLVPIGLGDMTRELNLRAVVLAQEARDRCAKERPVYIAGSVSNYGMRTGSETTSEGTGFFTHRVAWTEAASKANLREQAEILAEFGRRPAAGRIPPGAPRIASGCWRPASPPACRCGSGSSVIRTVLPARPRSATTRTSRLRRTSGRWSRWAARS